LKKDREITRIAYAKAWSLHGFKYFVMRGPLTWFLLIYLCFTAFAILTGSPPTTFRLLMNLVIAAASGLVVGALVFPILKRQIRKWDQTLTESEERKVQETLKRLHPFRQINAFIVLFLIFSFLFGWFFRRPY
jgi:hypothetical protein